MPRDAYTGRALPGSIPDLFNQVREPAHRHAPPAAKAAARKVDSKARGLMALEGVQSWLEKWGEPPTADEVGAEVFGVARDPLAIRERTQLARRALSDAKACGLVKWAGRRVGTVEPGQPVTTWEPCR